MPKCADTDKQKISQYRWLPISEPDNRCTDALCLRYGWIPSHPPSHCVCVKAFSVSHAFSCPHGAFPIIRHNDIRDLTARLLSEVCHDVQVESHLQPLTGEVLHYRTAVLEDDARVDI